MAETFFIMRLQIARKRLEEINEGPVNEYSLYYDPANPADFVECWTTDNQDIVHHLKRACYQVRLVRLREGIVFIPLVNPDGKVAKESVDPRTINTIVIDSMPECSLSALDLKAVLLARLIERLDRSIGVKSHTVLGEVVERKTELDRFWIMFNASPEKGQFFWPSEVWGHRYSLSGTSNVGVWLDGVPLMCEEGEEIGAMDSSAAYIYMNIFRDATKEVATRILEKLCDEITKRFSNPGRMEDEEVRRTYIKRCMERAERRRVELQRQFDSVSSKEAELQKELCEVIREQRHALRELSHFESYVKDMQKSLAQEFDKMRSMPMVEYIAWRGDMLIVRVGDVFNIDERSGSEHYIGRFNIVVDSRASEIRFFNTVMRVDGLLAAMHAPHVFPDGRPCLGTMKEVIPRLVGQYEWSAAVQMAIHFLRSVNVADQAGSLVSRWPVSRTEKEILAEAPRVRRLPSGELLGETTAGLSERQAVGAPAEGGVPAV